MKCNVGKIDKTLRILAGIIVIALGVYFQSWWGVIGLVLLATGIFRICPAYFPLGISTCKKDK